MNVLNRKMFANREARRKLANMGGIVASSPETLSVAQAYAPGGQVSGDRYIISVPGVLNGVGEYLEVSAQTLQRLNDVMPEVMMRAAQGENNGFVSDVETARRTNSRIATAARPGDAVVQTRLSRLASPEAPASPAPVQDDRTIRDVVREGLASSYSVGPVEALMNQINAQGPVPSPTGYGDIKPGQGYDAASLFGDGNIFTNEGTRAGGPGIVAPQAAPVTAAGRDLEADLGIGFDPFRTPTVSQQIDKDTSGIMGTRSEPPVTEQTPSIEDEQTMFEFITENPLIKGAPGVEEEVFDALTKKREDLNVPGTDIPSDSVKATELDEAIAAGSTDPNVIAAAERLQMTGMPDINVKPEMPSEFQKEDKPKPRPGLAKEQAGRGDLSTTVEKIVTNPDATPGEKNDQTAKTVISGLTGTDTSNMDTKELVNYYKDLFSEMLGESDEDKAEEKWLNMAMIGFAIASGESPSALQNIAGGLLEGTSMMMDQRAEDRKREDTITTLAIEQALGREKEDRELERLSRKRTADIEDALAEYEGKQIIKQKYTTITKDEPQWSKDLTKAFTSALGDMGGDFDAALNEIKKAYTPEAINIWMSSKQMITDDGTGQIVQQRTLDDIPDE